MLRAETKLFMIKIATTILILIVVISYEHMNVSTACSSGKGTIAIGNHITWSDSAQATAALDQIWASKKLRATSSDKEYSMYSWHSCNGD
eukprot:4888485-Amphidinium_carterae.1